MGFILKDWYGKEQVFNQDKIFVRDENGELVQFTKGAGASPDVRYVTFMSYDGLVEYGKKAVAVGDDCADPIARGVFATPTRESDAQYNYTFYGWATTANGAADSNWNKAVTEDKTVYANFAAAVRYYTITYYDSDGTTVLKTESLAYGAVPSYVPTKSGYDFAGWEQELVSVTGEASYTAVWKEQAGFASATWEEITAITTAGTSASCFAVGDTRKEMLNYADGTTEEIELVIAKIREDGTMVLAFNYALATLQQMHSSTTNCVANYFNNALGKYITSTVVPALSADLSAAIRPINLLFANRKVRLLTQHNTKETTGTTGGVEYESLPLFTTQSKRIRKRKTDGVAVTYWLGDSVYYSSNRYLFSYVDTSGVVQAADTHWAQATGITENRGVVLLFDV